MILHWRQAARGHQHLCSARIPYCKHTYRTSGEQDDMYTGVGTDEGNNGCKGGMSGQKKGHKWFAELATTR